MLWILMLLAVGLCGSFGFYDRFFEFSDQMRYINSGILVLLSTGLLIRTWILIRMGKTEKLQERIDELEKMLGQSNKPVAHQETRLETIKTT